MNGESPSTPHLVRGFGLLEATALNMTNMVGIGPFITIPLILAAMGGPQCILGWVLGALLALCDGLVWCELAAAMPNAGGTFLYLREAFRDTRWGALLPFLFIWQFIFSGPLEIASGYIGFAQYMGYFHALGPWQSRAVALAVGAVALALLYRRITVIGKMTVVMWVGMLVTVVWIVATGAVHFDARRAFDFPPGAFRFSMGFVSGLGSAMLIAMYNYLGYFDICFVAGEVRQPVRVIPRAVLWSVVAVAAMFVLLTLAIIGVMPWREAAQSKFLAASFMERVYGPWAGSAITLLILWSALGSVLALLLGYSRVPYAAALDGYFFKPFARLHSGGFPHISLLVVGGLAMLGSLLELEWVLTALLTVRILVQFVAQVLAVFHIRRARPDVALPFRMWLYPAPAVLALAGWLYVFASSGKAFLVFAALVVASGAAAFAVWRRSNPA